MATEESLLAKTEKGSRTFSDGVTVSWTPSETSNEVELEITIGGEPVWSQSVKGDGTARVEASGDNYKIAGTLSVKFSPSGKDGQLRSEKLEWTVQGDSHSYAGLIGNW